MHIPLAKPVFNNFPEEFELKFNKIFHVLKKLGCDYFYFLGINTGFRHRFCTHEDWIDFYVAEKLALNDPLKRVAEGSTFIALPWQQLTHLHGKDKRTMLARPSYGLHNGLTIAKTYQQKRYILTLATELKEHDIARYLLLEKVGILEKFIKDCMMLFDQHVKQ
ncbi:MAG: autoinducer binding domain-containing protein [Legionella sp.]|nr:autoinducer binding domain-containing protein [Legionella sp.]